MKKILICPYCWSTSEGCCPNNDYLELSEYIYSTFLNSDNQTRKQIIQCEQNKVYEKLREQSKIIKTLK